MGGLLSRKTGATVRHVCIGNPANNLGNFHISYLADLVLSPQGTIQSWRFVRVQRLV
jgi:hypothetical protein